MFAIIDALNVCIVKRFHCAMNSSEIFGCHRHLTVISLFHWDEPQMMILGRSAETPSTGAEVLALLASAEALRSVNSGLRNSRMKTLRLIQSAGRRGMSQATLASELGVSHAATSRLCDDLEADGMIVRTTHQFDRRMKTLHLSESGLKQVERCDRATFAKATAAVPLMDCKSASISEIFQLMAIQVQSNPCAMLCQQCFLGGC